MPAPRTPQDMGIAPRVDHQHSFFGSVHCARTRSYIGGMNAAYTELTPDEIAERMRTLRMMSAECRICPRACGTRRHEGEHGLCHAADAVVVASAGPHFGEESVLVGTMGSGTIFFTGCNLDCSFCQNFDISHLGAGERIAVTGLAALMLQLQTRGCHNINLVTPTHYTAEIVEAVAEAGARGLELPIVWNSGGYESVETLRMLEGIVDIYMPDLKYGSNEAGRWYSGIGDYWDVAREAVREMHRQVGDLRVGPRGIARRGLLVRHLVLPEHAARSRTVIDFLADEISPDTCVNVMEQYYPAFRAERFPELRRQLRPDEHAAIVAHARSRGLRLAD